MKTHTLIALGLIASWASCQTARPSESATSTGGGDGANACLPLPPVLAPPFHPQFSCCNGETCRGSCSSWLTGNGDEREDHCSCGLVTFDGQAHHGPRPCTEFEECCVQPQGNNVCVPKGQCFDCTPERSGPGVIAGCCAAKTACRGACGEDNMGPCSCVQPGDGGCAPGQECCVHPLTSELTCVPVGQCKFDLGPCPPAASSPAVAVACCNDLPCRGRCEDLVEAGPKCNCGGSWGGCKPDEECCLAPSGENLDPATHCVPLGECTPGG